MILALSGLLIGCQKNATIDQDAVMEKTAAAMVAPQVCADETQATRTSTKIV